MITNLSHVMTLANGIIGVSVLAMPYCFKQCGIILGILILFLSSILSKFACHLLVKSAVMSRRRNFEVLAFHSFGPTGKLLAELFIIGYLMGTCIAFFVVVGDLGPEIFGKMIGKNSEDIRTTLLIIIAIFVILPLGLLRNVDSLSTICTATIGFYLCLVLKVMTESMTHIFATDWYDNVFYWRPSGILQCLPIFSMALFCQTQLFEIYETIPNVSLEKMNRVVDVALNICTIVYIFVGFFGYVAFCTISFTGNILMSLEPSLSSEAIKIGFVLSVAFSFPLVIFPCRASLNSLLFRRAHSYDTASNYIPETRFRCLTTIIVTVSLITGILIPNIEFVLGLVGSTIGVMICLMFPAAFFISISSKNTNERLLAQAMLFIGVWIMILGTYANLYAMEESANAKLIVTTGNSLNQLNNVPIRLNNDVDLQVLPPLPKINEIHNLDDSKFGPLEAEKIPQNSNSKDDIRQEPPIPVERAVVTEKQISISKKPESHSVPLLSPAAEKIVKEIKNSDEKNRIEEKNKEGEVVLKAEEEKMKEIEIKDGKNTAIHKADNLIHSDAIRKEESELAADGNFDSAVQEAEHDKKHEELKKVLAQHEIEQRQLLQEQKEISNTIKKQIKEFEKEKKEKEARKKNERDDRDNGIDETVNKSDKELLNEIKKGEDDTKILNESNQALKNGLKIIDNYKEEVRKAKDEVKEDRKAKLDETEENKTINKSPGPILSALVKQNSNFSNDNYIPRNVNVNLTNSNLTGSQKIESLVQGENLSINNSRKLNNSINNNLSVPIALVMNEKTKKNNENLAIGRDILDNVEQKERIKRDVDEILLNENKKLVDKPELVIAEDLEVDRVKSFVNDIENVDDECSKNDKSVNNVKKKINEDDENERNSKFIVKDKVTTELLLIKTNSYLSDQRFADENSSNKNLKLDVIKFDKSNQRESLRIVNPKNGNRK